MKDLQNYIDPLFDAESIEFKDSDLRNGISPLSLFYTTNKGFPQNAEFWEMDTNKFAFDLFEKYPDLKRNEIKHDIYSFVAERVDPCFRIILLSKEVLLYFNVHTFSLYIYYSKTVESIVEVFEKMMPDYLISDALSVRNSNLSRVEKLRKLYYITRIKSICASVLDIDEDLINQHQTISQIVKLGHEEKKKKLGADYINGFDGIFYHTDYDSINIVIQAEDMFKMDMPHESLENGMTIDLWAYYVYTHKFLI